MIQQQLLPSVDCIEHLPDRRPDLGAGRAERRSFPGAYVRDRLNAGLVKALPNVAEWS